jgi:hypothetical protein
MTGALTADFVVAGHALDRAFNQADFTRPDLIPAKRLGRKESLSRS